MTDIDIGELSDDHIDEVIGVINAAFGFERSSAWYEWKHREGPWGPSRGLVATDTTGVVGVRLLLPWRFVGPAGAVLAYRAVEAATAPRAKGKGVFSRLNRELMRLVDERDEGTFLFSTPNDQSRTGYRKLGWSWLAPVPHIWRPVLPGSPSPSARQAAALAKTEQAISVDLDRISTDWSSESLAWRLDRRSGHDYRLLEITDAGVWYRPTLGAQMRALVPIYSWGEQAKRVRLLRMAARQERAVLVIDTGKSGGAPISRTPGLRRGGSMLAVWSNTQLSRAAWPVEQTRNWRLSFADLESVL